MSIQRLFHIGSTSFLWNDVETTLSQPVCSQLEGTMPLFSCRPFRLLFIFVRCHTQQWKGRARCWCGAQCLSVCRLPVVFSLQCITPWPTLHCPAPSLHLIPHFIPRFRDATQTQKKKGSMWGSKHLMSCELWVGEHIGDEDFTQFFMRYFCPAPESMGCVYILFSKGSW